MDGSRLPDDFLFCGHSITRRVGKFSWVVLCWIREIHHHFLPVIANTCCTAMWHAVSALEAFSFAFSIAISETSVPITENPFRASHMQLSPVPQPTSMALKLLILFSVTVSIRLKSGCPASQGVSPDLYLSLKRFSMFILSLSKKFDKMDVDADTGELICNQKY